MFTAGTETTSSTVEFVMSERMRNPEVMTKAQSEVRRVFRNKSAQDYESHINELRYLMMVIMESMRLHPVAPLLVPHLCRETTDIGGFEVVEGTRVMVNMWAMARNPEHWPHAEKFRFEYFPSGLGGEGSLVKTLGYLCWSLCWHAFSTTSTGAFLTVYSWMILIWMKL